MKKYNNEVSIPNSNDVVNSFSKEQIMELTKDVVVETPVVYVPVVDVPVVEDTPRVDVPKVKKNTPKPKRRKTMKAKATKKVVVEDRSGSVVPSKYKKEYGKEQSCGDSLANLLKVACTGKNGKSDYGRMQGIMKENGIETTRWADRNIGMIRMNLGNVLRCKLRKEGRVKIRRKVIKN